MLTSTKGKQSSFSFSIEKFLLGCLDGKYSLNLSAWSGEENSANMSSTWRLYNTRLKSLGQSRSHILSKLHIKMLAKAGPNGDPIATPSACL